MHRRVLVRIVCYIVVLPQVGVGGMNQRSLHYTTCALGGMYEGYKYMQSSP